MCHNLDALHTVPISYEIRVPRLPRLYCAVYGTDHSPGYGRNPQCGNPSLRSVRCSVSGAVCLNYSVLDSC